MKSLLTDIKSHVISRICSTPVTEYPFWTVYISEILPESFYQQLKEKMLYFKYNRPLQDRNWDNPEYMNKRYSLKGEDDPVIDLFRQVFDDSDIKRALIEKFYFSDWSKDVEFTTDLQFVFTESGRFQRIHTDIPAQILTCNFYLPEGELSLQEQFDNATIVYDKQLQPCKLFRYTDNSAVFFAPHFYSYHGFNTTVDNRNTLLFFYSQKDLIQRFYDNSKNQNLEQDPDKFKDVVQWKLGKFRLQEYGLNDMDFLSKVLQEKWCCRVNTLNGRIE